MKRIKLFVLALTLLLMAQVSVKAQDSAYVSNEYSKAVAMYQLSQRYNDGPLQKQALIEMVILTPRDTAVLRSLAELYYNNGQYVSSALVAQDMNTVDPNSIVAMEIQALSFENLRLYDKALESYEKLWLQTDNNNILYQIAYLQFSLKKYSEASNNLSILDSKITDADTLQLNKSDGNVQEVKFKAAMMNLKALIALDQGKTEEAKGLLQQALNISPDFEAAQLKLAELK